MVHERSTATLILAVGLLLPTHVRADDTACQALTLGSHVDQAAEQARLAFAATRVEEFKLATHELGALVPCLMEPVSPATAAEVHRMLGLRAFVDREPARSRQAFAAARALEPDFTWPEDLIPWGHPLLGEYQLNQVEGADFETLLPPEAGWVYVDGRPSEPRPSEWPAIIQVSDVEGAIQISSYVWPDQAVPDYPHASGAASDLVLAPSSGESDDLAVTVGAATTTVRRGPNTVLLAAAGTCAVAAGVLYGMSARSASTYWDPATSYDQLDAARARTNGLVAASAGLGAVALGSGAAAFLTVKW